MIIYIDFDGTISPRRCGEALIDPPFYNCAEKIRDLYEQGHEIVIYSCRANIEVIEDEKKTRYYIAEMQSYLERWNIPYTRIEKGKPHWHFLIDDRAVGCEIDWNKIHGEITESLR